MNPVLEALEALATTIQSAGRPPILTEQDVLEARFQMQAPAGLPCMIVAPPLQDAGAADMRRAA